MVGVFLGAVLVAAACGPEDPDAPVLTVTVRATRLVLATPLATAGTLSAAPASAATATPAPASISSATPATAANLRGTATPRVEPPTTATQAATPEPQPPRTPAPIVTPPPATPLTPAPTGDPAPRQPPAGKAARVVQVIDGDTVDVVVDGVEHTVRLLGIDAPEPDDTGGQAALAEQAREALAALVGDGAVILIADVEPLDDSGRLLRHVMRADVVLSVELARQGWVRSREYAPNALFRDAIAEAQHEARAAARGRWAPPVAGLAMTVDKTAETVVISNNGGAPLDLSGWRLVSLRGAQAVEIPAGTVLDPGATLTVASGSSQGDVAFGQQHAWHNEYRDSAELRRPDGRVALYWDDPASPG